MLLPEPVNLVPRAYARGVVWYGVKVQLSPPQLPCVAVGVLVCPPGHNRYVHMRA